MTHTLVICGHPDLAHSLANKTIVSELQKLLPTAEFDRLGDLYPHYEIDVPWEQEKLVKADTIVLQFPIFWYDAPALMRKWFEDVLTFGFAYGPEGTALTGKRLICSLTTGSQAEAYQHEGTQKHTIDEFLVGLEQMARLCGMRWEGVVHMGGMVYTAESDTAAREEIVRRSVQHAHTLVDKITHSA